MQSVRVTRGASQGKMQTMHNAANGKRSIHLHTYTQVCVQEARGNEQYTCVCAKGAPRGEKSHVLRAPSLLHSAPEEIESVKFKDPPKKIA